MVKMQLKKPEQIFTKTNMICIPLIFLFCITLFTGYESTCSFLLPDLLETHKKIAGDLTKALKNQQLSPGQIVHFKFNENKKSLGEFYALSDIKFIPEDSSFQIWAGRDKPEEWNADTPFVEQMQRFRIKFAIIVPDDQSLAGKTIKGTLHFKLTYPVLTDYTKKTSTVVSETRNRPISIHVFSKKEVDRLSTLKNQMVVIWIACLCLFLCPVLLIITTHQHRIKKSIPPRVE